jgi:hypothetical protein
LLSASLVNRSWSPFAPFRHGVIRYSLPNGLYCPVQRNTIQWAARKEFRATRAITQRNGQQPRCLQPLSFACLFPNLTTLDLAYYLRWKATLTHQRDSKSFHILDNEEISMLRTGPLITVPLAKNWSDDRTLLSNSHPGPPAPPNTRNPHSHPCMLLRTLFSLGLKQCSNSFLIFHVLTCLFKNWDIFLCGVLLERTALCRSHRHDLTTQSLVIMVRV